MSPSLNVDFFFRRKGDPLWQFESMTGKSWALVWRWLCIPSGSLLWVACDSSDSRVQHKGCSVTSEASWKRLYRFSLHVVTRALAALSHHVWSLITLRSPCWRGHMQAVRLTVPAEPRLPAIYTRRQMWVKPAWILQTSYLPHETKALPAFWPTK